MAFDPSTARPMESAAPARRPTGFDPSTAQAEPAPDAIGDMIDAQALIRRGLDRSALGDQAFAATDIADSGDPGLPALDPAYTEEPEDLGYLSHALRQLPARAAVLGGQLMQGAGANLQPKVTEEGQQIQSLTGGLGDWLTGAGEDIASIGAGVRNPEVEKLAAAVERGDYGEALSRVPQTAIPALMQSIPDLLMMIRGAGPLWMEAMGEGIEQEHIEKGGEEGVRSFLQSRGGAAIMTALNRFSLDKILGGLGKGALPGGVRGVAAETPTEAMQEMVEYLATTFGTDEEVVLKEMLDAGITGGLVGAGPGAIIGAGAGAMEAGQTEQEPGLGEELDRQQEEMLAERLGLPAPPPIAVTPEGVAITPEQQREREAAGMTPDVEQAAANRRRDEQQQADAEQRAAQEAQRAAEQEQAFTQRQVSPEQRQADEEAAYAEAERRRQAIIAADEIEAAIQRAEQDTETQEAVGQPPANPAMRQAFERAQQEAALGDQLTAPEPELGDALTEPEQPGDRRQRDVGIPEELDRRQGDRRQDLETRRRVEQMSPEEMRRELLTSEVTGIPNRRAYDEAEKLPTQASIDVDSLKWVNDNAGHESGDQLLRTVAAALSEETDQAFHISGDEFVLQAGTPAEADAIMARVNERLKEATIHATLPDGTTITLRGVGLSYGTGGSLTDADQKLQQQKSSREAEGARASRGEQPPGAEIQRPGDTDAAGPAAGQQDRPDRPSPEEEVGQRGDNVVPFRQRAKSAEHTILVRPDDSETGWEPLTGMDGEAFTFDTLEEAQEFADSEVGVEFQVVPVSEAERITSAPEPAPVEQLPERGRDPLADPRLKRKEFRSALETMILDLPVDDPSNKLDPRRDDILTAIRKIGGVNREALLAEGFDPADLRRVPPGFFRRDGDNIDGLRERLAQDGYPDDLNAFLEAIDQTIRGNPVYSDHFEFINPAVQGHGKPSEVRKAIRRALAGEPMGPRQRDIVTTLLDEVTRARTDSLADAKQILEEMREKRRHKNRLAPEEYADPEIGMADDEARAYLDLMNALDEAGWDVDALPIWDQDTESLTPADIEELLNATFGETTERSGVGQGQVPQEQGGGAPAAESDLAGPVDRPHQALTDEERERDRRRNEGSDDLTGTLFGADRGQKDMLDVPGVDQRPPANTTKIDDFGEHLEGARKDYAQRLKEAAEQDVASAPLSKTWPEPDYQALVDGGADPWVVGFVRAARDEVPARPRKPYKLKQWVAQVELLRGMAQQLLDGSITKKQVRELLAEQSYRNLDLEVGGRAELYAEVGHQQSLKGVRVRVGEYSILDGQKFDKPKTIWTVSRDAKATAFSNWPRELARGDTREEAIANFKERYDELDIQPKRTKQVSFDIYSYRRGPKAGKWIIGKKIGKDRIDLQEFDDVAAARKYRAEHQSELEEQLARLKRVPDKRMENNAPRVGVDHRNGADVTPEMFTDAFGFRGVQFGNYVEGGRRQQDLNEAYDALMDMAGVLGVPSQALSLNGKLGLAFGARGKGGKGAAKAHFEPDTVVINLTKREGAGSLAHEWWHALDNYFSRARGKKAGMTTEAGDVLQAATGGRFIPTEGMRTEMIQAYAAVVQGVANTALPERSRRLDRARTKDYWSTMAEMTARTFERYIIAKLEDQGQANDYLANIVSEEFWKAQEAVLRQNEEGEKTYPYPNAGEVPAIRAAYDNFFDTIETRETDEGVELYDLAEEGETDTEGELTALGAQIEARLAQVGIADEVTGKAVDEILTVLRSGAIASARGSYARRILKVALTDPQQQTKTLNHELIHALRDLGLFSDAEWRVLTRAAESNEKIMAGVRRRYRKAKLGKEKLLEEAVADLHAAWVDGQVRPTNAIQRILQRITDFLKAIKRAFGQSGFTTAEEIFQAVQRGEMGQRLQERRSQERDALDPGLIEVEELAGELTGFDQPSLDIDGEPQQGTLDFSGLDAGQRQDAVKYIRNVHVTNEQTGTINVGAARIQGPKDVVRAFMPFVRRAQENLVSLVLDKDGKPLEMQKHTVGTTSSAAVDAAVMVGAMLDVPGAAQVFLIHNHPSGKAQLSDADRRVATDTEGFLEDTGVDLGGMLAVTTKGEAEIMEGGFGAIRQIDPPDDTGETVNVPVTERTIERQEFGQNPIIDASLAKRAAERLSQGSDGILLLDTRSHPVAFIPMTPDEMGKLRMGRPGEDTGKAKLLRDIHQTNANGAIIVGQAGYLAAMSNTARFLNSFGGQTMRVLDAVYKENGEWVSSASRGSDIEAQRGPYFDLRDDKERKKLEERAAESNRRKAARKAALKQGRVEPRFTEDTFTPPGDQRVPHGDHSSWESVAATQFLHGYDPTGAAMPHFLKDSMIGFKRLFESASDRLRRIGMGPMAELVDRVFDTEQRNAGNWNRIMAQPVREATAADKRAFAEWAQAWDQKDNAQARAIYGRMSETGQALADAWRAAADMTGKENQRVGVQVFDAKLGKMRPIGKAANYYPRKLQEWAANAIYNPTDHPADKARLVELLIEKGLAENAQDAEKFIRANGPAPDKTSNDYFSAMEKARTDGFPPEVYDYTLDTALDYGKRWAERLAQIEVLGQDGTQFGEAFDAVINEVQQRDLKQYLRRVKARVYNEAPIDPIGRVVASLNMLATGTQLGNPRTAMQNLITGSGLNYVAYGRFAAKAQLDALRLEPGAVKEAEAAGVLRDDILQVQRDLAESANVALSNFTGFTMRYGGYNITERQIRLQAYLAGKHFVRKFVSEVGKNPMSGPAKRYIAWMQRNNFDYEAVLAEGGKGPLTDRVLRYIVNMPQGSYKVNMTPVLIDEPMGRFFFKYQKYGTQVTRMVWMNHMQPFIRSLGGGEKIRVRDPVSGQMVDKRAFDFMSMLRLLALPPIYGYANKWTRWAAFGTLFALAGPDWEDIEKALEDEKLARAAALALQLAWESVLVSGILGIFQTPVQIGRDVSEMKSIRNPLDPPGLGPAKATWGLIDTLYNQGTLTAGDIDFWALRTFSLYNATVGSRPGRQFQAEMGFTDKPALESYRLARATVQKEVRSYAQEFDLKSVRRRGPTGFAPTPQTPVNRDIADSIILGRPAEAKAKLKAYLDTLDNEADVRAAVSSVKTHVRNKQPIVVGGQFVESDRRNFLDWASSNLHKDKYQRIVALDRQYRRSAQQAGLLARDDPKEQARTAMRRAAQQRELSPGRRAQVYRQLGVQ